MYYNTLVKVVSMDVETIAVIKKNSKNNNTKGCVSRKYLNRKNM